MDTYSTNGNIETDGNQPYMTQLPCYSTFFENYHLEESASEGGKVNESNDANEKSIGLRTTKNSEESAQDHDMDVPEDEDSNIKYLSIEHKFIQDINASYLKTCQIPRVSKIRRKFFQRNLKRPHLQQISQGKRNNQLRQNKNAKSFIRNLVSIVKWHI